MLLQSNRLVKAGQVDFSCRPFVFLFLVVNCKKRDKCVREKIKTLESIKEVDDKASSSTRTCSIALLLGAIVPIGMKYEL